MRKRKHARKKKTEDRKIMFFYRFAIFGKLFSPRIALIPVNRLHRIGQPAEKLFTSLQRRPSWGPRSGSRKLKSEQGDGNTRVVNITKQLGNIRYPMSDLWLKARPSFSRIFAFEIQCAAMRFGINTLAEHPRGRPTSALTESFSGLHFT